MDSRFAVGMELLRRVEPPGPGRPWRPPDLTGEEVAPAPAEEDPPSSPLHFDEHELARAMSAACAELRDRLRAAWAAAEAERLSHETTRLREALERIATVDEQARRETRHRLAQLIAMALRRLVPVLLERLEEPHLLRLLEDWAARLLPEEPVRVFVRPVVRDRLAARFESGGADLRFELLADPDLPPGGLRLERAEGRVRHHPDELLEELVVALGEVLGGTDPSTASTEENAS